MSITSLKSQYRNEMLQKRADLSTKDKNRLDSVIIEQVSEIIADNNYQNVHCYLPMGVEINLNPLLENLLIGKKTIICPKTAPNRQLQHLVLKSLDELEDGIYGTKHPINSNEFVGDYDLIIVPGLAFDKNKYRLGYGGGYYDNFIQGQTGANTIGLFYSFQEIDEVPIEPHDIGLDTIITENGIL